MGINPIEYRPWKGERTPFYARLLAMLFAIPKRKLKSPWLLGLIVIAFILVHVFPLLMYPMTPHEDLDREIMVGPLLSNYIYESGDVYVGGNLLIDGEFETNGSISILGDFTLEGNVSGIGQIITYEQTNLSGYIGYQLVNISGYIDYQLVNISEDTYFSGDSVYIEGYLLLNGSMEVYGSINGSASGEADCYIYGDGVIKGPAEQGEEKGPIEQRGEGAYIKSVLFILFTILIAALVTSDLISEDISNNSFVLYFSRPIRPQEYLGGKLLGALSVLSIYCLIPPVVFCIAMIGTQTGSDYGGSLKVLGSTFVAGLLTSYIFLPYGLFLSSMTKRRAFAAIGTFMSIFVLFIIASIFQFFNYNWLIVDPMNLLFYSYDIIYGYSLPGQISPALYGLSLTFYMVVPLLLTYIRIQRKGVGK